MGSLQTGSFIATDPDKPSSNCPATGVKYIPKAGTPTSSTPPSSSSTGGAGTFAGQGYLNVNQGGTAKGCLIGAGTWYVSGTCATYTATASGEFQQFHILQIPTDLAS
jgi:ribonuclease T2